MVHDTGRKGRGALDSRGHLWFFTPGAADGFSGPKGRPAAPRGARSPGGEAAPGPQAGARGGGAGAAAGAQGNARRGPRPTAPAGRPQSPAGRAKRKQPGGPGRSQPKGAQPGPSPPPQRGPPGEPRSRATRRAPAPIGRASERGTKRAVPRRGRRSPDGAGARPPKGRAASRTGRGGWGPGVPLKFAAGLRRQTAGTGWGRGAGPRIGRSPLRGAPSAPGTRGRAPPGCGAAAPQSERSEQVRQQPDRGRPKGGPLLDKRTLFHQQTFL